MISQANKLEKKNLDSSQKSGQKVTRKNIEKIILISKNTKDCGFK